MLTLLTLAVLSAGPDVQVSRESDFPHVEMTIAAHPSDPKKLVAGSMFLGGEFGTTVYSSTDGGTTWSPGGLAESIDTDADPWVVYTPRGTALYVVLPQNPMPNAAGKLHMPIVLYRSEDGRPWQKPVLLGTEGGYDHPVMAADPRSGRVYVAGLTGRVDRLELFRSDDDGRTFGPPRLMVQAAPEGPGMITSGLAFLADGTLVHSYSSGDIANEGSEKGNWVMLSRDGGETFSEPVLAGRQVWSPKSADQEHRSRLASSPHLAAAGDRIYLVWTDYRSGLAQAVLTSSADRGKTWSEPKPVAGTLPEGAYSFQAALAVNKDGVLGVSWLDTRNHPGTDRYDAWFSASLDGGATFLPAVRLSSESSDPLGIGNQAPSPGAIMDSKKTIRVAFLNALSSFPHGGDYVGLAAAADGAFHPLWPDSRSGTFHAWTARVQLAAPPIPAGSGAAGPPVDVSDSVELTFDPAQWDGETRELRLPVRIRNLSNTALRGPLQVRVKTFGSGPDGEQYKENAPTILNAANGEKGAGAVFDYSQAFGSALEPGAATRPVVWRFRTVGAGTRIPNMHVEVLGVKDGVLP